MESCWGSLKTELVHHCRFATREQAKREITAYIEIFYNRIRKQARLGHLSPAAFSQQYHAMQMADLIRWTLRFATDLSLSASD